MGGEKKYDTSKSFKFPYLMACAGFGGCISELLSIPFDTIKVLKMNQKESGSNAKYQGTLQSIRTVVGEEGIKGLYFGLIPGFHRQMLYASLRIALFYRFKEGFGSIFNKDENSVPIRLISGIFAGSLAICVGNPAEVVKIRYQSDLKVAKPERRYTKGVVDAYQQIFKGEKGIKEFYVGLPVNMFRNAIYNAAEVVTYDMVKEAIISRGLMNDTFFLRVIASTAAGAAAVLFGSPADVIKTRLMANKDSNVGVFKTVYNTFTNEGFSAFYKGAAPQLVRLVSFNVTCFLSFETAKDYLLRNKIGMRKY